MVAHILVINTSRNWDGAGWKDHSMELSVGKPTRLVTAREK